MKRMAVWLSVLLLAASTGASSGQRQGAAVRWVGTWTTAAIARHYPSAAESAAAPAAARPQGMAAAIPLPKDQTLRQIVRITTGGDRLRVTVTNAFGTNPLAIGAARVAIRASEATIAADSSQVLTFSGRSAFEIPPGAIAVSDPVTLRCPSFADLAIDLFFPGDTGAQVVTIHRYSRQTSYLSAVGNHVGVANFPVAEKLTAWYFLGGVEVAPPRSGPVIVALGDSITDGTASTTDANRRWPDQLARRLGKAAVLNAGIGGNRLLSDSIPEFGYNILARFNRDVLMQPGATHVVILEGINDIGNAGENAAPSAPDLIAALKQLIDRAQGRGLRVIGATLTPFGGAAYFTEVGEAKRQAVNAWIRTGHAYDGVIDFDRAVLDPGQPTRFKASFDSGDHLHPSDAGYEAMGSAIDLALFK
ncbi:MAG TPA: SGNH/GDSL hydrolase family protein [Vicinamibacterales bacterium]